MQAPPPLTALFLASIHLFVRKSTSKPAPATFPSHSVPSMQFQVLLTFLSKFFSTFLRSTFPLSVSVSYLDLGELYLLLCAEIPINTTLENEMIWGAKSKPTGEYHPLCCCIPTNLDSLRTHQASLSKGASETELYFPASLSL